jgi:hypothetical protein
MAPHQQSDATGRSSGPQRPAFAVGDARREHYHSSDGEPHDRRHAVLLARLAAAAPVRSHADAAGVQTRRALHSISRVRS